MVRHAIKIACLTFLLLWLSAEVIAQKGNPMFYKEIQLLHKPYTLHTLTKEMQRQTGITFSYNASKINAQKKIRIKPGKLTVDALLSLIKKRSGVSYKVVNDFHIIYAAAASRKARPKKGKARQEKAVLVNNRPVIKNEGLADEDTDIAITGDAPEQQIVVVGDSLVASYYYIGGGGGGYGGAYSLDNVSKFSQEEEEGWDNDYVNLSEPGSFKENNYVIDFLKENTLAAIGFSADELYYFNPTARFGFDFLYGTVSYNIGSYPHWRYGLGASTKMSERWRLHVNVNTGGIQSASFNALKIDTVITQVPDPPLDSLLFDTTYVHTNTPFAVNSRLTRFTLSASYDINRHFSIGAGVTLNHLKTNYTSNNNPVALRDILPFGLDADMKYRSIDPPYTLGNSYNASESSNVKIWLGVQLTFIYRLNFFEVR